MWAQAEPYITVPIDLNLVFIGFNGDGHYKLNLQEVSAQSALQLPVMITRSRRCASSARVRDYVCVVQILCGVWVFVFKS